MIVFEQYDSPDMPQDPNQEQPEAEELPDPMDEIIPLKKYYLTDKLIDLQSRLFKKGIQRDDLDFILQFQNELSYDVLIILTNAILDNSQISIEGEKDDKE